MFVGHLAVALAAKPIEPKVPLAASVAAAFGIDLLWPILLLLGAETVRVDPGNTAFTQLAFDSYPWSHSLLMVIGWSVLATLAGKAFFGRWRAGLVLGGLVLSHWILDAVTHRPDLPVWPGGPLVGLGLWNSIPGTLVVEGTLLALGIWAYVRSTKPSDRIGVWSMVGLLSLTGLIWASQPWAPPPPDATAVAWGALILWVIPPWAYWAERHRESR